jgi:hypothetical protein
MLVGKKGFIVQLLCMKSCIRHKNIIFKAARVDTGRAEFHIFLLGMSICVLSLRLKMARKKKQCRK